MGTATTTETDQMLATKRLVKVRERCGDRGRAMVMYLESSVTVMIINVWQFWQLLAWALMRMLSSSELRLNTFYKIPKNK